MFCPGPENEKLLLAQISHLQYGLWTEHYYFLLWFFFEYVYALLVNVRFFGLYMVIFYGQTFIEIKEYYLRFFFPHIGTLHHQRVKERIKEMQKNM